MKAFIPLTDPPKLDRLRWCSFLAFGEVVVLEFVSEWVEEEEEVVLRREEMDPLTLVAAVEEERFDFFDLR